VHLHNTDAIAGVINIILKDSPKGGSATLRTGLTSAGDGEMIGVSPNNGSSIGMMMIGFINYTVDFSKTNVSNRPGTVDAAEKLQILEQTLQMLENFK
jgi:iron complex outermembrane receptor protein